MQEIIAKAKVLFVRGAEKIRSMRKDAAEEGMELVREAETEEIFVEEVAKETLRERWGSLRTNASALFGKLSSRERIALIFIVGIAIGFGAKTMATGSLTIGYRDYTTRNTDTYDLIALQKKVAEEGSNAAFSGGGAADGGTCSQ
jgi:hypothetical protein